MSSGKSKSHEYPNGERRIISGNKLAPRSLRKKGKRFLKDCTNKNLEKIGLKNDMPDV